MASIANSKDISRRAVLRCTLLAGAGGFCNSSKAADRLIACTWGKDTYSLVCNPGHPCMHADPAFPDLAPGQRAAIGGKLIFFKGSLDAFTKAIRENRYLEDDQ